MHGHRPSHLQVITPGVVQRVNGANGSFFSDAFALDDPTACEMLTSLNLSTVVAASFIPIQWYICIIDFDDVTYDGEKVLLMVAVAVVGEQGYDVR